MNFNSANVSLGQLYTQFRLQYLYCILTSLAGKNLRMISLRFILKIPVRKSEFSQTGEN
jgi:hypothetical protein